MKSKILGLLAVGLLTGPVAANAIVRYEFTAISSFPNPDLGGTVSGGFVLEAAGFIVPPRYFKPDELLSCSMFVNPGSIPLACGNQEFLRDYPGLDSIAFIATSGGGPLYHFNAGTFGRVGTFVTVLFPEQRGRLVITDLVPMPEPGTLVLLSLGLAGLGMSRLRKAA